MIKVLTLMMMLMATNVFANEPSPFEGRHQLKPITYTNCVEGQIVFIVASQYGVATIQMFKDTDDMVPKPIECEEEEDER